MSDSILDLFDQMISPILKAFLYICIGLILTMTVVISLQVILRYFFGNALPWPEELARYLMVWMTFLIAPYAYRKKLNVGVEVLSDRVKGIYSKLLGATSHLMIGCLSGFLFFQAVDMTIRGNSIESSSLGIEMSLVYGVLPVSFFMIFIVSLEKLVTVVTNR